ncbi:neuronal acetylcholine receptor subunit alpha-3-like [Magallana gigas]|uniref:neuronal acetylcholine receptor subunit alpha-3-like n=1 Tax=Magallana gigas TaxID=29159 RepID=UPI003341B717
MRRSRKITIWMLYVLIIGREYVSSQTGTDIKNLYTYLFTTLNYNKDIRPATDQTAATDVSMELLLTGFHGLHEATQQMSSMGILTIKWKDEFLTWTPSSYGGATYIDVPQGKIWKPDLQIQNGMTSFSELGGSFMSLRIFSTGDVSWQPYKVFNTKCLINIAYFPYDRQQCSIKIVAWNSDSTTVNLTKGATPFTLDDELNDGQWAISDPTANTLVDDGSSLIIYRLNFVRKPKYAAKFFNNNVLFGSLSSSGSDSWNADSYHSSNIATNPAVLTGKTNTSMGKKPYLALLEVSTSNAEKLD